MKTNIKIPGLVIIKKLGEGGQGEVFHIRQAGKEFALKLYNEHSATKDQRAIIKHLVDSGAPGAENAGRFAWPQSLVDLPESKQFGYLMPLIDMNKYTTLADIDAGRVPHPGFAVMSEVGRQLAGAFRAMHIGGYCCRDISANNFLFCAKTGNVVICDNDNVVVDGQNVGNILGTPQFMAPEVILGKERPSTITDLHSLAILLFMLLCGGNPFYGEQEYNIKIFDGVAAHEIYGRNPVFVFDPDKGSNRLPNEPGYRHVARHWKVLPTEIRKLFTKAFTIGLGNPAARVTDLEWKNALSRMQGQRHVCSCGAENFWDPYREKQQACWHKGCAVAFPEKLHIDGGTTSVLLAKPGQRLTSLHFGEKTSATLIGEMEKHPTDTSLVLLRNKTGETWNAKFGNQQVEVHADRAILLHSGIQIKVDKHILSVRP